MKKASQRRSRWVDENWLTAHVGDVAMYPAQIVHRGKPGNFLLRVEYEPGRTVDAWIKFTKDQGVLPASGGWWGFCGSARTRVECAIQQAKEHRTDAQREARRLR